MSPTIIFQDGKEKAKVEISKETLIGLWYGLQDRYHNMNQNLNLNQSQELKQVLDAILGVWEHNGSKGKEKG
jgi:hypothetical protein